MDDFKMSIDEMISALDTACGMLTVQMMRDPVVRQAHELVQKVSMSLGEASEIRFNDYTDEELWGDDV